MNRNKEQFMNNEPLAPHLRALAPDLAARINAILVAVTNLMAYRFPGNPRFAALLLHVHTYLRRVARRLTALMDRIAAGRPSRPATPRTAPRPQDKPGKPRTRFPAGRGWLIAALPGGGGAYAGYLEQLLAVPAFAELLAAIPAARRILAPIRHALSTAPSRARRKPIPYIAPTVYPSPPRFIPLHLIQTIPILPLPDFSKPA